MPTYVYRREDGTKFEIKQRITADPLEECPETGQPVERIIAGSAGLIFKGDGFYINDYAKSGGGRKESNGDTGSEGAASQESSASEASGSESTGDAADASTGSSASESSGASSDA